MLTVMKKIRLVKDGLPAELVLYKQDNANYRYSIVQKYRLAGRVLDRRSDHDAGSTISNAEEKLAFSLKGFKRRGFTVICHEDAIHF